MGAGAKKNDYFRDAGAALASFMVKSLEETPAPPAEVGTRCAELVARVLAGDTDAFRPLVEAFEPAVFGLCRKLASGDGAEAEDLAQETMVQAYRYLPTLKNPERFAPWLYQIARSLWRSRARCRQSERRVLQEWAETLRWRSAAGGDSGAVDDGGSGRLAPMLAELPADQRELLSMRYFEGLSYEAIAARLGWSFSRVDHSIRKARAHLARRLDVRRRRERAL
jgi:RNA polymerase sigma-70 factor (ECF subfamily)